ncbi:MAG: glycosyltransferase, partial [Acetobacter malorum]|uniref:glycosyltransferase family 32 protein n=1 Tax=Acetobacter malorum TaxID=178901 RepID=UPI0039EB09D2
GSTSWKINCEKTEQFKRVSIDEFYQQSQTRKIIIPQKNRSYFINKFIHQTHDENELPEIFQENVYDLKKKNTEWEYIYWSAKDRKDFIYDHYGWDILKYYLKINPRYGAARADLFRYLCIYKMGGVYLDLKSSCHVPLNNIIKPDDQYLLSQWHNKPGESFAGYGVGPEVASVKGGEFQQWHIIAAAGHPFLEKVIHTVLARIHRYTENLYGVGKISVLRVTGPYPYTMSISPCLHNYPHRMFDSEDAGLIYSFVHDHGRLFKRHYSQETVPLIL